MVILGTTITTVLYKTNMVGTQTIPLSSIGHIENITKPPLKSCDPAFT